jgi:hypothetical protein
MSSEKDFLKSTKEEYSKLWGTLTLRAYANEDRDESLINKIKGLKSKKVVEDLFTLIDKALSDSNKLLNVFIDDTIDVKEYMKEHRDELHQIGHCCACKCIECISTCSFGSCGNCPPYSKVEECDKKEWCMMAPDDIAYVYNKDIGKAIPFNILAIVESNKYKAKRYILLQETTDAGNKQIFIIDDSIQGIEYLPITNQEELEYVSNIYMEN